MASTLPSPAVESLPLTEQQVVPKVIQEAHRHPGVSTESGTVKSRLALVGSGSGQGIDRTVTLSSVPQELFDDEIHAARRCPRECRMARPRLEKRIGSLKVQKGFALVEFFWTFDTLAHRNNEMR